MSPHPPTTPNCPEGAAGLCRPAHIAWSAAATHDKNNNHAEGFCFSVGLMAVIIVPAHIAWSAATTYNNYAGDIVIMIIIVNDDNDCDSAYSMGCSNNM